MSERTVFWDVDTQHDFMDADGKLAVPGAGDILDNLRRLTAAAVEAGVPMVASADAHEPHDREFDQFGEHCVRGTPGQAKVEATAVAGAEVADARRLDDQVRRLWSGELRQLIVEKTSLDVFAEPVARRLVSLLKPQRAFVYGVTTEHCVLRAVLGLLERRVAVTVVTDAVKAISEAQGREALERMRDAGAGFASTDAVLASLERLRGE